MRDWFGASLASMPQALPNPQLRFVQLGFRVSYGTVKQFGNLPMLVAIDFVEQEDCPVSVRKFFDRLGQSDAVN
jgi:hypothetical protein